MRPKILTKVMAAALSLTMAVTLLPGVEQTVEAAEPVTAAVEPGDVTPVDITWRRSEETAYSSWNSTPSNVGEIATGIDYRSNGQLIWEWSDIGNLQASETDNVWDYQYDQYADFSVRGDASAATWVNWQRRNHRGDYQQSSNENIASARRFVGTFTWPEGYDVQDMGQLISVNDDNYEEIYSLANNYPQFANKTVFAINDDMYVFIHKASDSLTAENYMNYLAFWSGTSGKGVWAQNGNGYPNTEPDSYNGVPATRAFHGVEPNMDTSISNSKDSLTRGTLQQMQFSDTWYTFADTSGISTVLQRECSDIQAGDEMVIEIFAFDYNSSGGMDELKFQLTKRQPTAQSVKVEYYVDFLNSDGYLGETYLASTYLPESEITLDAGTDASQLNYMKLKAMQKTGSTVTDGEQQGSIPYIVQENENNVIQVLYRTGSAMQSKSFVIDYGKDVSYTKDEVFGVGEDNELADYEDYEIEYTLRNGTELVSSKEGTYGTMSVNSSGNDFLQYSLDRFMNGIDSYTLDLELTDDSQTTAHVAKEVNMIPASNVYYEDDFTETSNADSSVKIVYSNGWTQTGEADADDTQSSENITYGYDESYANQLEASNGTVHSSSAGATASFQFTGTGTDIYSFTDDQSGTVMARLYKVEQDGTETFQQFAYCNNYAQNGTYYTVPTVSFSDLEYGTYKVSLAVYTSSAGTSTYYLDGIRIYNPLGTVTDDNSAAGNAYKEAGELNAKYTEIRTMLLKNLAETDGDGMLYIDNLNGDTKDISVYESDGPEHEIYLGKDSAIAFTLQNFNPKQDGLYVGIKSAKGENGQVTVTSGNTQQQDPITIDSTMDQYYKITPDASGNVVIKNTGAGVIALTKVRTTSPETKDITFKSTKETLQAARAFALMPVAEEVTEAPDSGETTVDQDDVVIENPDQNESTQGGGNFIENVIQNAFKNVFDSIFNWFWGR